VFEDTRSILEPAGALSIAGPRRRSPATAQGQDAGGGGFRRQHELRPPAPHRRARRTRREARSRAGRHHSETPGSFKTFCGLLGARNITEFNYRYSDPKLARVFVGLSVPGAGEGARMVELLQRHGLEALDLTDNEMAKLHIRHLVGGRAPEAVNEVLYRFEFPERPGALMRFSKA
jgi:threonine dehydratase